MERIDEIIEQFENAECPKDLEQCPMRVAGNDCDNFCPFVEGADMLKEYKRLKDAVDGECM